MHPNFLNGTFGQSYARAGTHQTSIGVGASIGMTGTSGIFIGVGQTFLPAEIGPGGASIAGGTNAREEGEDEGKSDGASHDGTDLLTVAAKGGGMLGRRGRPGKATGTAGRASQEAAGGLEGFPERARLRGWTSERIGRRCGTGGRTC